MQTKKKVIARNYSRDAAIPRMHIQHKKGNVADEKKVGDLITASAKKQKNADLISSSGRCTVSESKLKSGYTPLLESEQVGSATPEPKVDRDNIAGVTLFSPGFHHSKDGCGGFPGKVGFVDNDCTDNAKNPAHFLQPNAEVEEFAFLVQNAEAVSHNNSDNLMSRPSQSLDLFRIHSEIPRGISDYGNSSCGEVYQGLGDISSEVSAIYVAMQQSNLHRADGQCQDSLSIESRVEYDEDEEFDDFDPYLFIKSLPDLASVVPRFRPLLLPKQTRSCPSTSLVLDLDETLVHSVLEPCEDIDFTFPVNFNLQEHTVFVRCRPHLKDFLERVSCLFEIIVFTASQSIYAGQLLNVLDPKRKLFRHRVYRDACVYVEGNYLKDLSVLGRDLSRVIIVDNSPQAFGFQIDNGVPIESWFDDRSDRELLTLLPFLESLVGVEDVRPLIAKKFNLREKVAAAAHPVLAGCK